MDHRKTVKESIRGIIEDIETKDDIDKAVNRIDLVIQTMLRQERIGSKRNKSGGKESRSRDLDHIMGSRFTERTGQDKKWVTDGEWVEMMEKKKK